MDVPEMLENLPGGGLDSDFLVGHDKFEDLNINPTKGESFYYFYNRKRNQLVKHFVLAVKPQVKHVCGVTLIKKGEKFTPRLVLFIRDTSGRVATSGGGLGPDSNAYRTKARVDLSECHANFWALVAFLESLRDIEIPKMKFSLVSQDEAEIVSAIRERGTDSLRNIIRQLSETKGVLLSEDDVNHLLQRKEKLAEFEQALRTQSDEGWWQDFFEENKWIFGYGLNYQILRQEQSQPHYGGTNVSGAGGQEGDFLVSTLGDISFTVLVEIKTPTTPLLQGNKEIRRGAWSLSKDLGDALSQLQANVWTWEKSGADQSDNRDRFEGEEVYTVRPKGIIVIGSLSQVKSVRAKRETFQRFRGSIHGIDIVTFDELYRRARFIVGHRE